jgi:hypothetical protein
MERTQQKPSKGKYCADQVSASANHNDRALITSRNHYKSFFTNSINKSAAITLLLMLQRNAPTQMQISEFDLDEER